MSTSAMPPPKFNLLSQGVVNLLGQIAPMLVAIFSIPALIHGLGIDRFGVLTLAWLVVGYFSLFDLGLGRALTQVVASRLGCAESGLTETVRTSLLMMLALGLVGASVAAAVTPVLMESVFRIPAFLVPEASISFYLLSISLPVVILTAGLIGILSAYSRFDLINWVRVPLGISNYLIPLAVLQYSTNLAVIVGLLSITRVAAMVAYWLMCKYCMKNLVRRNFWDIAGVRQLFRFGGWMTVTNVVGPIMIYMDRFVIGTMVSVAAVAFYATPFEMVTKLLVFPAAIVTVLFPALSVAIKEPGRANLVETLDESWKYVLLALYPISVALISLSREGLNFWLGTTFADQSTLVLQLLTVGVLINSLAQLPFTLIQSAGRPDITAKLHIIELLLYVPCLIIALEYFGIAGAAFVWMLRVAADGFLLIRAVRSLVAETEHVANRILRMAAAAAASLLILVLIDDLEFRLATAVILLISFTWVFFQMDLIPQKIKSKLQRGTEK